MPPSAAGHKGLLKAQATGAKVRIRWSKAPNAALAPLLDRADAAFLQYSSFSGLTSCKIVVAISSIDLVVVDSQRMPSRRIIASASWIS